MDEKSTRLFLHPRAPQHQGNAYLCIAPFRRAGASPPAPATQPPPGAGIGLSMVKRRCELLDASLEAAGAAETGTTFRVVLPRQY
jgi:signal transduction histidine kinase